MAEDAKNRRPGQGGRTEETCQPESGLCAPMGIGSAFVFLTIWAKRERLISMVLITGSRTNPRSSEEALFFLALRGH